MVSNVRSYKDSFHHHHQRIVFLKFAPPSVTDVLHPQVASEKREGMEKKLRQKLEEEVEQLRREREGERQEQGVDIQQLARQMAEQEVDA